MLEGIEHLETSVFRRLLRTTVLLSMVAGALGILVALLLDQALVSVGIILGLGVAILNLRSLDAGVAKVEESGEGSTKIIRKMLRGKTAGRLAVITALALLLLVLIEPLGLGMVIGLVIFQILFVVNVARVVFASGSSL